MPLAVLITWRMLTGSVKQGRMEARARDSHAGRHLDASLFSQELGKSYPAKCLRICNNPCRAVLKIRGQSFLRADQEKILRRYLQNVDVIRMQRMKIRIGIRCFVSNRILNHGCR